MKNIKYIFTTYLACFGYHFFGYRNTEQSKSDFSYFAGSDITICALLGIATRRKMIRMMTMAKNLRLKMARAEHDMTQGDLADCYRSDPPDHWPD